MDDMKGSLQRARTRFAPPEPAFDRLLDRRRRKQRNARIASIAVAFVVVAGGVAGAGIAFGGGGHDRHVPNQLGNGGPSLVARDGQYYYSKTQIYFGGVNNHGLPTGDIAGPWTLAEWIGTDMSGRALFADYAGSSTSGYSWPDGPDTTYGPGKFPTEDLTGTLSADPQELGPQLADRSNPGGASPNPIATTSPGRTQEVTSILRTLQDLFNADEQFTPPLVRAAMFDVARGIEGVEVIPNTRDPVGRPAIGLRWVVFYQAPPSYVEWYFDPQTKQFMAETWTQGGHLLEARIVTEAGIANSTQQPPRSDDLFFPEAEATPSFGE